MGKRGRKRQYLKTVTVNLAHLEDAEEDERLSDIDWEEMADRDQPLLGEEVVEGATSIASTEEVYHLDRIIKFDDGMED